MATFTSSAVTGLLARSSKATRRNRVLLASVAALPLLTALSQVQAANKYWDLDGPIDGAGGVAPAGTWDTGVTQNWNLDSTGTGAADVWAASDTAIFSAGTGATGAFTVTIPTATTATAAGVTVEEGTILIGPGTLSFGAANGVVDVATGASLSMAAAAGGGVMAGTGGVTKNSGGTLFLGATQGYSKATGAILTVNGGVVDFSGDTALGAAPTAITASAVTLNGGTLRYSGTAGVTLGANRGMTIGANGGTVEVPKLGAISGLSMNATGGVFAGNGILTKTGAGRFTLNNTAATFTGKYKVLAGLLNVGGDNRMGTAPTQVVADYITLDGGGLRISVTTSVTLNANRGITIGAGGGRIIQPGASTAPGLVYNGIISGTLGGGLTFDWQDASSTTAEGGGAGGIISLGGANTYNGSTTINPGLTLRPTAAGVIPDTSVVTLAGSAAIFDLATNTISETVKSIAGTAGTFAVGTATLTLDNPNGETYSSVITAAAGGKVIKNGTGTLVLSGNSTGFGGEFIVNSGKIGYGGANSLGGSATAGIITLNGGTLSNTGSNGRSVPATVSVNLNADFTVDDSLFGPNPGQILFNGPSTIKNSNRVITVAGAANLGLGGVVGQDVAGRSLTKDGSGTLALNAINTYSGDTTLLAGQINIDGDGTLGDGTGVFHMAGKLNTTANRSASAQGPVANPLDVTVNSTITTTAVSTVGANIDLNLTGAVTAATGTTLTFRNDGASDTGVFTPRFTNALIYNEKIAIVRGAAGGTVLNSYNTVGNDHVFNGEISGTGGYMRNASTATTGGLTVFNAANIYSGTTSVSRGTVRQGIDSALSPNSPVDVSANGILDLNVHSAAIPSLAGTGGSVLLSGNLTTGSNDTSTTYSGSVTGTANLAKVGLGTQTLSGTGVDVGGLSVTGGKVTLAAGSGTPKIGLLGVSGAQLDVTDNRMVLTGTSGSALRGLLLSGRAADVNDVGQWTGNGVISANAAADANKLTAIGYLTADDLGLVGGGWGTATGVASGNVLTKVTPYGDIDLSGSVTRDDLALMDRGLALYGDAVIAAGTATWINGDVNYDGIVDAKDFVLADAVIVANGLGSPELLAADEARFGAGFTSAVMAVAPEPTSLALLAVGAGALLGRRRRAGR